MRPSTTRRATRGDARVNAARRQARGPSARARSSGASAFTRDSPTAHHWPSSWRCERLSDDCWRAARRQVSSASIGAARAHRQLLLLRARARDRAGSTVAVLPLVEQVDRTGDRARQKGRDRRGRRRRYAGASPPLVCVVLPPDRRALRTRHGGRVPDRPRRAFALPTANRSLAGRSMRPPRHSRRAVQAPAGDSGSRSSPGCANAMRSGSTSKAPPAVPARGSPRPRPFDPCFTSARLASSLVRQRETVMARQSKWIRRALTTLAVLVIVVAAGHVYVRGSTSGNRPPSRHHAVAFVRDGVGRRACS